MVTEKKKSASEGILPPRSAEAKTAPPPWAGTGLDYKKPSPPAIYTAVLGCPSLSYNSRRLATRPRAHGRGPQGPRLFHWRVLTCQFSHFTPTSVLGPTREPHSVPDWAPGRGTGVARGKAGEQRRKKGSQRNTQDGSMWKYLISTFFLPSEVVRLPSTRNMC